MATQAETCPGGNLRSMLGMSLKELKWEMRLMNLDIQKGSVALFPTAFLFKQASGPGAVFFWLSPQLTFGPLAALAWPEDTAVGYQRYSSLRNLRGNEPTRKNGLVPQPKAKNANISVAQGVGSYYLAADRSAISKPLSLVAGPMTVVFF